LGLFRRRCFQLRLCSHYRPSRGFGKTVSAPSSGHVLAVSDYSFALEQHESLLRPEDVITETVGHVKGAVFAQANNSRPFDVKILVMFGDDRILGNRIPQFGGAFYAARDHGIGINRAGRVIRIK
jgi:hypothetical protein